MIRKMKIVFFGTPEFGADILKNLIGTKYQPSLIVTNPDKPAGRDKKITESPVSKLAKEHKIPVLKPKHIKEIQGNLEKIKPDLMIVAAYGKFLPIEMIELPEYKTLNVHPSLLPKYRGSSPIQYAILNGDKKTGVTIMLINEEMDKGDILSKKEVTLKNEIYPELSKKLSDVGSDLLKETIPKWIKGGIKPQKQNEKEAVYTKILDKYDGKIDWKQPAKQIERQVRAFNPWPGTYAYFISKKTNKETLIKVIEVDILEQTEVGPFGPPGKVYMAPNSNLAVQTGKDFLVIKRLQIEGKNPVATKDYLQGNIDLIGIILI